MNILLIETATEVCSVALAKGGEVAALRESSEPNAHSVRLPVYVKELMEGERIDGVCVSAGPGSYTGLRIGTSTAKGLCYALDVPLLSVSSLLSMAALYYRRHAEYRGMVCPMIDARRMECYTMMVAPGPEVVREVRADVVAEGLYDEWLDRGEVVFIGNGAAKTQPVLGSHPNARFDAAPAVSAVGMLPLAMQRLEAGQVENVAYYEPFYLKDFVAKRSVVHGLRD